jgi:hypothetical protein
MKYKSQFIMAVLTALVLYALQAAWHLSSYEKEVTICIDVLSILLPPGGLPEQLYDTEMTPDQLSCMLKRKEDLKNARARLSELGVTRFNEIGTLRDSLKQEIETELSIHVALIKDLSAEPFSKDSIEARGDTIQALEAWDVAFNHRFVVQKIASNKRIKLILWALLGVVLSISLLTYAVRVAYRWFKYGGATNKNYAQGVDIDSQQTEVEQISEQNASVDAKKPRR